MTYFGILFRFLVIPILLLLGLHALDSRRQKHPGVKSVIAPWQAIFALVLVALIYTTPWDNYLVATGVWYYDPQLVTGLTLGWVPIEEYTFFLLQPIFTGLLLLWLLRRLPPEAGLSPRAGRLRQVPAFILGGLAIIMTVLLASRWAPGTYLALELVWALPPIILQLAFGADILWQARRPILLTITISTLYLGLVDALAIRSGTWTISTGQSLNVFIAGILPIEEFIFFLLTNVLVIFGLALVLAPASRTRFLMKRAPSSGSAARQL